MEVPLLGAEFHLFRAFQEPEFRRFAWMFALREPYFETPTAITLSRAIKEAFPKAPPEGSIAVWLSQLSDEAQRAMEALRLDFRGSKISEAQLADSVEWLKRRLARRDLMQLRRKDLTQDERQQILQRMKELNPDTRRAEVSEDDDPFA